jgi:soluble lytic murein transglycosylase
MGKVCIFFSLLIVLLPLRLAAPEDAREPARYQKVIKEIAAYLKKENVALSERQTTAIADNVYRESSLYRIDYRLILALMKVESNFKEDAVSRKGAMGLLQIKPSVGESVAKNIGMSWTGKAQLREPGKNIKIGVHHLSSLIRDFTHIPTALDAYNRGARRTKTRPPRKPGRQARYTGAVMGEYAKTICLLPDP